MFGWLKKQKQYKIKTLGQLGEEFAQQEYKNRGLQIITANFFNRKGKRLGEVDFIAKDKHRIIFVEVKSRTAGIDKFGKGIESVNQFKQTKLLKAVKIFLNQNPKYQVLRPQIDVCLVEFNGVDKIPQSVKIIPNAVEDWS